MNAREVEAAETSVARKRRHAVEGFVCAGAVATAAVALGFFSIRVALALGAGAALQAVVALALWLRRRELIERLAVHPEAYTIPDVARFGSRVASVRGRQELAARLEALVRQTDSPWHVHLTDRVRLHARDLEAIARELVVPSSYVRPASAVACRRLLTRTVRSPLYNPHLPEEDLTAVLARIRTGINAPASPQD
jgi:hypothetical protein